MMVTVFRSRLDPANVEEYKTWAARMSEMARSMPGYRSHKSFTAEDGERVNIVEFEDAAGQEAWRTRAEHLQAQAKGRREFYLEYKLQVCEVVRESVFTKARATAAD
jgi:heme-degrading monooxygenase HmoA